VTIIPLIISTDKTQLTIFRNKSAYPVYLTIGNIPKEIHCKLSSHAYMLISYLPTTRLQHVTNASARCRLIVNLYHACMCRIFSSIIAASCNGTFMTSGHRITYCVHPLLTCIVGDYPECHAFFLTVRYDWTGPRLLILTIYRLRDTMTKHDVAAQHDSQ
jgi:Plavaka transposase